MLDRESHILEVLDEVGTVHVSDLALELGVSAVTVRKDLDQLERRQLLRRIRGGAVPLRSSVEGAFGERTREEARAKKSIARAAAAMVVDGDVVALDSSTTAHAVGVELLDHRDLVIVTQSLPTATLFLERSNAEVVMPGGVLRRQSASLAGISVDQLVGKGRISIGFFGCAGLTVERGLLELAPDEAIAKRVIADVCDRVVGVLAAPKAVGFGFHTIAETSAIDDIVTDERVGDAFVAEWEAANVRVTCVPSYDKTFGRYAGSDAEASVSDTFHEEHR